jgi:DNA adenine methylase
MSRSVSGWLSCIERLPEIHERLRSVQVEQDDFRHVIARFNRPGVFMYADPPYVADTRTGGKYVVEMSDQDHRDLIGLLLDFKGKVLLSGYANPLYEPLETAGWRRVDICVKLDAAMKTGEGTADTRIETIWMNYDPPVA